MSAGFLRLCLAGLLIGWIGPVWAGSAGVEQRASESGAPAPLDSPDHRKYARDREIDILHLTVDVTPDFKQRTVAGVTRLDFKPIAKPFKELRLDAVELDVQSVTATEQIAAWQNTDEKLIVNFAEPIPPDRPVSVTIQYRAQPTKGLYFRTPEMGYKEGDTHLFTQGQAIAARHWYPMFDEPNEKFTSEVICRVPEGMTVVSNGKLVEEAKDPRTGLVAVRWLQDKPHVNYLLALVAGYFQKLDGRYRDIPLTFYTPPSLFAEAPNSFRGTDDMMAFFEREIGVPYPWAKYAQVCVNDFVAGGMENTSLTILTEGTLFPKETENLRSSQGLVAHEVVHQWFGDLVTCKDWSHVWLNEGFATYYETLYDGYKHGPDMFLYRLYEEARGFIDLADDNQPMVNRQFGQPDEQFSYLAYPKGAWIAHMLRCQLGAELFRRCIKTFLERHQYGSVVTEDLNRIMEESSGRSFDQFFDQYVYHAHHPELEASYSWDEATKLAKLSLSQVQALSDKVLLFKFPLPVRFKVKEQGAQRRSIDREVLVKQKEEDFYFALPSAPEIVRLDPGLTVLAKIKFQPPSAMLQAQLTDEGEMMGRLLAVVQLSGRQDHDSVARLKERLNHDPFFGVRLEASKALRAAHTHEAMEALLASVEQSDARVRRQVREDLRSFFSESVLASTKEALKTETNPDIVVELLAALRAYSDQETEQTLLRYLNSESFRNLLADAAIRTMRAQDKPTYLKPLLEVLQQREAAFTSDGFAAALSTLARLARNEEDKDNVREFLTRQVNSLKKAVQRGAIAALGELGDPKAIPVVETFTRSTKSSPERQAAERALGRLRAERKTSEELQEMRAEVLALQKDNRAFRKEVQDLKDELRKKLLELAGPGAEKLKETPAKKKKAK
jgi:aminopeptidase N